jgi:hypothetical protein
MANEKRYRVELERCGIMTVARVVSDGAVITSGYVSGEHLADLLNSAYESGLEQGRNERMDIAVVSGFEAGQKDNEKYRLAWEEALNLAGSTPDAEASCYPPLISLDEMQTIAHKHGIKEE